MPTTFPNDNLWGFELRIKRDACGLQSILLQKSDVRCCLADLNQSPSAAKCRCFWANRPEPLEAGEVMGVRFPDPGASASEKRIGVRWMSVLGRSATVAPVMAAVDPLQSFVTGSYPASENSRTTGDLPLAAEHDEPLTTRAPQLCRPVDFRPAGISWQEWRTDAK